MLADYFYWQYVWGPHYLLTLGWSITRLLARAFSVPIMLKTLAAPWHRDQLAYRAGTLSNYAMTFAWNVISRVIGFIIRGTVLLIWLSAMAIFIPLYLVIFIFFILWPLLVVISLASGLVIMTL